MKRHDCFAPTSRAKEPRAARHCTGRLIGRRRRRQRSAGAHQGGGQPVTYSRPPSSGKRGLGVAPKRRPRGCFLGRRQQPVVIHSARTQRNNPGTVAGRASDLDESRARYGCTRDTDDYADGNIVPGVIWRDRINYYSEGGSAHSDAGSGHPGSAWRSHAPEARATLLEIVFRLLEGAGDGASNADAIGPASFRETAGTENVGHAISNRKSLEAQTPPKSRYTKRCVEGKFKTLADEMNHRSQRARCQLGP